MVWDMSLIISIMEYTSTIKHSCPVISLNSKPSYMQKYLFCLESYSQAGKHSKLQSRNYAKRSRFPKKIFTAGTIYCALELIDGKDARLKT